MSAHHESLQRLLTGARLRGSVKPESSHGAPACEFDCLVQRLAHDPGTFEWSFDVAVSTESGSKPTPCTAAVRWAGPVPVVSFSQVPLPDGRLIERAEIIVHNGLFAGLWVSAGVRGHVYGVVEHEQASAERVACYVIERSGEALREWWTGKDWSEKADTARWYEHEPDPAHETGNEAAHAVFYPSGVLQSG